MSTAADAPAPAAAAPVRRRPALDAACDLMATDWTPWRMVLSGLTWADYDRLLAARAAADRRAVRITYDRGEAEVMTVGFLHERWKGLVARLLEALCLAWRVPLVGAGNMTVRREDLDRGFEPDVCYYVRNAARMATVARALDFRTDPPPDLAIEVEVTRRLADRLGLYAAIGVPEVWRFDGARLTFLHRTEAGGYAEAAASLAFPGLTADLLAGYLARAGTVDDTALCLELFAWAQQHPPTA